MLSQRPRKSSNSVEIKWTDPEKVARAVHDHASRLKRENPKVERVIWFGSRVNGLPTPGSDVDLCIVVSQDDRRRRDRIPDFLPTGFPVGIDLFVYTRDEFARLQEESPHFYEAITSGIDV